MNLSVFDYIFIFSLVSIWLLLLMNIILALSGYSYYSRSLKMPFKLELADYPQVSILIPAHNEEKVIGRTVKAILSMNYPRDSMEVIVINDNSVDKTGEVLESIRQEYKHLNFKVITTDNITGGKGKSNALNLGFENSSGEYIAVYDADNTPEKNALLYLVQTIHEDKSLGAVIGKFRTRNKSRNLLTRFINIETLSFQWLSQAGRWELLGLCTIPGTNFIIRRELVEKLEGWDVKAVAEDTEISFRLYKMGYRIKFIPLSVTWEQEPETLRVWFKQRTRWAKGNIYVLVKYIKSLFTGEAGKIWFDLFYFFSVYFFFLSSVVLSDIILVLNICGFIKIQVQGNFFLLWILAYILFILEVGITLAMEKGEGSIRNLFLVAGMYFTYCQLWIVVAVYGIYQYLRDIIFKREAKWYKTERF